MITFQPDVQVQPTKIDWYWKEATDEKDGSLREIRPEFIVTLQEAYYAWSALEWQIS